MNTASSEALAELKQYIDLCRQSPDRLDTETLETLCSIADPTDNTFMELLCVKWYLRDVCDRYSGGAGCILIDTLKLEITRAKSVPGCLAPSGYLLSTMEAAQKRDDIATLESMLYDLSKLYQFHSNPPVFREYASLLIELGEHGIFLPENFLVNKNLLPINHAILRLLDDIQPQLDFKTVCK